MTNYFEPMQIESTPLVPDFGDDFSPGELRRLQCLHDLQLLDTAPSRVYDRITQLAALLFEAEISLISLVDAERQWFLSKQGLEVDQTDRSVSFCNHVVLSGEPLDVKDARLDPRFSDNPLVTGFPHIRSYLGQPIKAPDGELLGTLCVIDPEPDAFAGKRRQKMVELALTVEDLIAMHKQVIAKGSLSRALAEQNNSLEKANRIFTAAEKAASIGFWEVDIEHGKLTWSDNVYLMYGFDRDAEVTLDEAIDAYDPADRGRVANAVSSAVENQLPFEFEAGLIDTQGIKRQVHSRGEYLAGDGEYPARIVGVIHDITEQHHTRLALERAANYDSLTDLYNRHALDRLLGETIKRQRVSGETIGVVLLDLDGFKAINDTFGHLAGDVILEEVSARIARCLPAGVIAARWGGDEFVFIPPLGATQDELLSLWDTLVTEVERPVTISGRRIVMHATGGAELSEKPVGGRELMRRADLALYDGKRRSAGALSFYDEKLEKKHAEKQIAINEVRQAIDTGRLYAGYQPIVDLETGRMIGLEALMRLIGRNGSELTASHVLPAILDPHVSREIGECMITQVCDDHADIMAAIPDFSEGDGYISVNATEADLLSQNFETLVLERLEAAQIPPSALILEVTETMLMVNDYDYVRRVLNKMKDAGVKIALDDFGTGYSSLTHLRDFPIDIVKIDQSFVQGVCSDNQSRLIVQALLAMAKSLDIRVIAEGIETEAQRAAMHEMGCRYGQGYLLGRPQMKSEFEARALRNAATDLRASGL